MAASGGVDPSAPPGADAGVPGPGPGADGGVSPGAVDPASRSASLKAKRGDQLARDLAEALELPRDQVCKELGSYDCAVEAHRIVLGGVEPYVLRIDEPLDVTPVSAPIAVDRVALSACGARARADFASPASAVVFGPLAGGAADGVERAIDGLYERLLARAPDAHERELLRGFREDVPSTQDWAVLSCFVVATSLEHLFY